MALTCKIGPSLSFDVVAYIRNQMEDTAATPKISDEALKLYIEAAAEEFSKWEPLGEFVVGNFSAATPSSPLHTINGVTRYSLTPGNGFVYPVIEVLDVLFKPSGFFTAANEYAYASLMPISPMNWFASEGDLLSQPSNRIIRDAMLSELSHYGSGYWVSARDANGVKAIDIFPAPTDSVTPIFVRYTSSHINVPQVGGANNGDPTYPTIPENLKRYFAKFALIETLQEEAGRFARSSQLKAGVMQRWSNPAGMASYIAKLKEEIELAMGSAVTIGIASH